MNHVLDLLTDIADLNVSLGTGISDVRVERHNKSDSTHSHHAEFTTRPDNGLFIAQNNGQQQGSSDESQRQPTNITQECAPNISALG